MNPIKVDINDLDKYFVKSELTPAIAFDVDTKTVLMLAYMNKESLKKTLETGYTWYWSRSGCTKRSSAKGSFYLCGLR